MAAHTPAPWAVGGESECLVQANGGSTLIAECVGPLTEAARTFEELHGDAIANAKMIVRAVNCHEDLLAACRAAAEFWKDTDSPTGAMCRAAVEKATT